MKKVSFVIAAVSIAFCSCAQNINPSQAPAVVINAFQQQYPKATDVEWEKKGANYEVEFEVGVADKDHTMLIDPAGKIISHKQDIYKSELPTAVLNALSQQFSDYKTDDVEKIETGGVITYKMEVKKKPEEWKVVFAEDGKVLEKIAD
jgi:uncharacterized membrane protein YkoI